MENNPIFLVIGFPLFFILLWLLINFIVSRASGWYRLSQHYGGSIDTEKVVQRLKCRRCSMGRRVIGGTSFKNMVTFTLADKHLGLTSSILFRPFLPPLTFHFSEITAVEQKYELSVFSQEVVELRFAKAADYALAITVQFADKLEEASNGKWSYQRMEKLM